MHGMWQTRVLLKYLLQKTEVGKNTGDKCFSKMLGHHKCSECFNGIVQGSGSVFTPNSKVKI